MSSQTRTIPIDDFEPGLKCILLDYIVPENPTQNPGDEPSFCNPKCLGRPFQIYSIHDPFLYMVPLTMQGSMPPVRSILTFNIRRVRLMRITDDFFKGPPAATTTASQEEEAPTTLYGATCIPPASAPELHALRPLHDGEHPQPRDPDNSPHDP